ncbi:sialidase family protein [Puniceicoccus vermicola]|uniref:Exo-alpha-sialidase n=1 Tax=Puniceicoccus vermicola TaxID=388746 RepID=A0A7X1B064_9BACT|nr:sialidase family protein [Puniceicoccus vermicola]MBC2603205.1 exo-alpha-sialidase [Puniceicoccus vermicola]
MTEENIHSLSLTAPEIHFHPGPQFTSSRRLWQGIPGIEQTSEGILYATWYSGGTTEGIENHVLLVRSDDDGRTWSEPLLVIDPAGPVRAFDPVLWVDPSRRLWLFWAQSQGLWNGRGGVWCIRCEDPNAKRPAWTSPRRIANGVMMNKPLVRSNGEWLLPIAVWGTKPPRLPELAHEAVSSVFVSTDSGETFTRRGGVDAPHRCFDEHMLVERNDGTIWMLVRTVYGIGQSTSPDGGATWTTPRPTDIAGPNSRFFITRLSSGRLLMVNHFGFTGRSHLTASLSEDDGHTWLSHLLLDPRPEVSYPDATITPDGRIRIIYDRERYKAREILLARITEEDILAGKIKSAESCLQQMVNKIEDQRL